ncbi:MAG TPA: DoxX family protein [Candidatus Polarisedimenticolaceae bacterium]
MRSWIFDTRPDLVLTLVRLVLAGVFLPHGLQKTVGWFGGYGYTGTMQYFTGKMGIPAPLAFAAIAAETLGPIALVLGLGGRVAAAAIVVVMAVAVATTHLPHGFFMNWFGNQNGEGFEFHLLAVALALVVVLRGSGAYSVDAWIAGR